MFDSFPSFARRALRLAGLAALVLSWASPAAAQISRVGVSKGLNSTATQGTSVCYDTAHSVYLYVGGFGSLTGIFANTSGDFISSFGLGATNSGNFFGHKPRCVYSPDLNSGNGGFLVIWEQSENGNPPDFVHSVVVAYPTGVISQEKVFSDNVDGGSFWTMPATLAYSRTSHQYIVAWVTLSWTIRARLIDASGSPIGLGPFSLVPKPNSGDSGVRDPDLAWNPATNEFALANTGWTSGGGFTSFRRLSVADGSTIGSVATFAVGFGNTMGNVAVNEATNQYLVGWTQSGGGSYRAVFDQSGTSVASAALISSGVGTYDSLSIAFNPISGTFLAVGHDNTGSLEDSAIEVTGAGAPIGTKMIATNGAAAGGGSYYPEASSRTDAKEWGVSYARNFASITSQIISTATSGGPPPPPPGGIQMVVDTPGASATITPPFGVGGWAVDTRATVDNGIASIHVWAVPTAGANGGTAVFVGALTPDVDRTDIEQIFGSMHKKSGFGVLMSNLPPGQYMLVFYPQSSFTGQFDYSKVLTRNVNVTGGAVTQIATPTWGDSFGSGGQGMQVTGYAVDLSAQTGTGIDAVHVWAIDTNTGTPTFLGAATLNQPNAQSAAFGSNFANGGFTLTNGVSLSAGFKYILVYSHSVGAQTFNFARLVGVFVQ